MASVGVPSSSNALGVAVPCQLAATGSLTVGALKPRLLDMPDAVLERIDAALTPVDRLRAQQTCRRFCDTFGGCHDVVGLEIRYEQNACCAVANSVPSTSNPSACHYNAQQPHHYLTARAAITSTLHLPSRIVGGARKRSSFSAVSTALTQLNGDVSNASATASATALKYRVRLVDTRGVTHRMRTLNARDATRCIRALLLKQVALRELTIWDACLTSAELIAPLQHCAPMLTTLRLWNCRRYFLRKICGRDNKPLETLFGFATNLRNLLVLESGSKCCSASSNSLSSSSSITSTSNNTVGSAAMNGKSTPGSESGMVTPTETCAVAPNPLCQPTSEQRAAVFGRQLAIQLRAPIENLQLTGIYLPLRSMEAIAEQIGGTCQRLAIGCTFGKEAKRLQFLRALANMKSVSDLDFPPFIFHLRDSAIIDPGVQQLIHQQLPLKSMGFRHYNSTVLFRFIETQLPHKIRFIRVYHNANRVPNFAELGQGAGDQPPSAECDGGCDCDSTAVECGSSAVMLGSTPITPSSLASSSLTLPYPHHHHQLAGGICAFLREKKLSIIAKYNMLSTSRSSIASSTTTDNGYATTQSSSASASATASTVAVICTACRSGKMCSDHGNGKLSCSRSSRTSSTSTATTTTTVTHNDEEDEYDSNNNIFNASSSNSNNNTNKNNLDLSVEHVDNDSRRMRSSTYGGNHQSKVEYDNTNGQQEAATSGGIRKSSNFDDEISKNRNSYGNRQLKFDGVREDCGDMKLVPKSKSMSFASGQHYYGIGYGMDDDAEPLRLSASSSSSASSSQSGFGMLSERHSQYQLRDSDIHSSRRSTNSGHTAAYGSQSGVVLRKRSLPQAKYSDSCSVGGFNYYGAVTRGSSIANCCHSMKSSSGSLASTTSKCYKSGNNCSSAEGVIVDSCCGESISYSPEHGARRHHYSVGARLAAHRLTIFAVAEERSKRRTQRLRKRTYCGVDVIYMQETLESQEIFGRMALPMQSPHVYSKSFPTKTGCAGIVMTSGVGVSTIPSGYGSTGARRDNRLRIIKGDLVKPIPLSSLGMESDYELSDWEA